MGVFTGCLVSGFTISLHHLDNDREFIAREVRQGLSVVAIRRGVPAAAECEVDLIRRHAL